MKLHTRQLTCAAIVGAAYAVLSIFGSVFGITYGPIQCRFSEALCVLPFLMPETAWGLGVGCLIANLLSPYGILDIVVGSAATLLAALLTARCKKKWLAPLPPVAEESAAWQPPRLPWWRRAIALVSGLLALVIFWHAAKNTDLTALVGGGAVSAAGWSALWEYALFIAALFVTAAAIGRRSPPPVQVQTPVERRKLSKRTKAAAALILVGVPAILFVGSYYFDVKNYYLMALLVMLACMLPFFMVFEGRKPQARELTIIAVLCALGVAARAAFFMLPQFKPVVALTIISGVAFGGETGFLVGAMTMLASNFLFSQGPWTPFQMFAAGIIGFLAGVLFRKGWLRRSRAALCSYGAIAAIVLYGGLMNPVAALLSSRELSWQVLMSYYITGFPVDCVHAAATVFFLWVLAEPMLEKLDRIKTKYGLVE